MKKVLLFPYCIPFIGYQNSIIVNFKNSSFYHIPISFFNSCLGKDDFDDESIEFILLEKLGLLQNAFINESCISKLNLKVIEKYHFEVVTIEVNNNVFYIIEHLSKYKIKTIEFYFLDIIDLDIEKLLLQTIEIHSCSIVLILSNEKLIDYVNRYIHLKSISFVKIFNAIKIIDNPKFIINNCNYTDYNFWLPSNEKFLINFDFFKESIFYNTVFNKRIFIKNDGSLLNHVLSNNIILNLFEDSMIFNKKILELFHEYAYWKVNKDNCNTCCDCEYRYICNDGRIPMDFENEKWILKGDCPYNPYIALWKGQEGWISVEQWRAENSNWEKDLVRLIPGKDYYKNSLLSDKNI